MVHDLWSSLILHHAYCVLERNGTEFLFVLFSSSGHKFRVSVDKNDARIFSRL